MFMFLKCAYGWLEELKVTAFGKIKYHKGKFNFIRFYSDDCYYSSLTNDTFHEMAHMFPTIVFSEINCNTNPRACNTIPVIGTPSFFLVDPNSSHLTEFGGYRTVEGMTAFLERFTGLHPISHGHSIELMHPLSVFKHPCSVILFYNFMSHRSQVMLDHVRSLAKIYEGDNVTFGRFPCGAYPSYCFSSGYSFLPIGEIQSNESYGTFRYRDSLEEIVEEVNRICNLHRTPSGTPNEKYGIDGEIIAHSQTLRALNRTYIEQVKDPFIKRILNDIYRKSSLDKTLKKITNAMATKGITTETLDELFRRKNIIEFFSRQREISTEL